MRVATEREAWVGRSLLRVEDEALLRGEGRFIDDLEPVPHAWHAAIVRSQLAHARVVGGCVRSARRARCARRAHRRGRRRPVATFPGRDRVTRAALGRGARNGPLRRRAACGGRRPRPVPRRGRGRARRRRLRAARGRRRSHGRGGDPRAPLPLRRRRRRPRVGRSRRPDDVPGAALHGSSRRVLRRRLRLGRAGREADRLGELPGAVHAARRRGRRPRPPRRPASAAHAARLGRLVRRQGGGPSLRRARRARGARAGCPGALDGGPHGAPRCQLRGDRKGHRGRGRVHARRGARRRFATTRSRTSAPTCGRPSRPRSTGCTGRCRAPTACGTSPRGTASSSRTPFPRG